MQVGRLFFVVFAGVHLAVALAALMLFDSAPIAATCLFIVEFITFYDNFIVSIGNWLGISTLSERLNRGRFFMHGAFISLLLPVYLGIAQASGVSVFRSAMATTVIYVLTAVIAALGFEFGYRRLKMIMPINYFGCLRYAQSVGDMTRREDYSYSEAELQNKAAPPLASILTVLIGLVISAWIGIAGSFWLPFLVTALMFSAASFPIKTWGPLATSVVEVIFSVGLLYSLFRLLA